MCIFVWNYNTSNRYRIAMDTDCVLHQRIPRKIQYNGKVNRLLRYLIVVFNTQKKRKRENLLKWNFIRWMCRFVEAFCEDCVNASRQQTWFPLYATSQYNIYDDVYTIYIIIYSYIAIQIHYCWLSMDDLKNPTISVCVVCVCEHASNEILVQ